MLRPTTMIDGQAPSRGAILVAWTLSIGAVVFSTAYGYRLWLTAHDPAEAARFSLVGGLTIIIVATGVRFALRRARTLTGVLPSPLVLGLVALAALGFQIALRDVHNDEMLRAVEGCRRADPTPFGAPPAGTSFRVTDGEWARLVLPKQVLPDGLPVDAVAAGEVVDQTHVLAYAYAYPGARALRYGLQPLVEHAPGGVAGVNGCWAIAVIGRDTADTTSVLAALTSG